MANEYDNKDTNNKNTDLGTQGTKDTAAGKAKEVGGKVQRKFGEVTGNDDQAARGRAKEVEGKVQQTGGKVERKVDDALNS